jgi:hypothetical protein
VDRVWRIHSQNEFDAAGRVNASWIALLRLGNTLCDTNRSTFDNRSESIVIATLFVAIDAYNFNGMIIYHTISASLLSIANRRVSLTIYRLNAATAKFRL